MTDFDSTSPSELSYIDAIWISRLKEAIVISGVQQTTVQNNFEHDSAKVEFVNKPFILR